VLAWGGEGGLPLVLGPLAALPALAFMASMRVGPPSGMAPESAAGCSGSGVPGTSLALSFFTLPLVSLTPLSSAPAFRLPLLTDDSGMLAVEIRLGKASPTLTTRENANKNAKKPRLSGISRWVSP
jgi:hypothetical protein